MALLLNSSGLTLTPGSYSYGLFALGGASAIQVKFLPTTWPGTGAVADIAVTLDDGSVYGCSGIPGGPILSIPPTLLSFGLNSGARNIALQLTIYQVINITLQLVAL